MTHSTSSRLLFFLLMLTSWIAYPQQDKPADSVDTDYPPADRTVELGQNVGSNPLEEYNEAFYVVNRLNTGIGNPASDFNLRTPQATLEHFMLKCEAGDYEAAAYALNLNRMPQDINLEQAAELARKLHFVIDQRVSIDWSSIPDRPDGQIDIWTTTNQAIAGSPRRSISFGEVTLDDRDIVMRVQRIKYQDWGAFWAINAETVENIDALYAEYGPRKLDRMMPSWARFQVFTIPVWKLLGTLLLLLFSVLLGRFASRLFKSAFAKSDKAWLAGIAHKVAGPAGFCASIIFFYFTITNLISFSGRYANWIYTLLLITMIASITWLVMRFIDYLMVYIAENRVGDTNPEENQHARQMLTYVSVARRIITFGIILIGGFLILSQFQTLEKLGISLLASAGVVSIILGVAAQSTLGNIIAGVQIALTSPAKIGDTVNIDGELGYVEDIKFTYLVMRTWDQRRLVIPLKWITTNIFENFSMTNAQTIRSAHVYADESIDVQEVRDYFIELIKQDEDYCPDIEPKLQVVDVTDKGIQLRAICPGKTATATWDLHCRMREKLVKFIYELEGGKHLATERIQIVGNGSRDQSEG